MIPSMTEMTSVNTKSNRTEVQMQGAPRKLSEHSLESLDLMRSIWNLHMQQRQNRFRNEFPNPNEVPKRPSTSPNVTPQGPNLIMFTPPPGQNGAQDAPGGQSEPKKQRSPRRRKKEVNGS